MCELTCSLHHRLASRSQWITAADRGGDYIQGSDAGWWEKSKVIGIRPSSDGRRRLVKKATVHDREPVKLYTAAPSQNGIPSLVIWGHGEVPSMGRVADHPSGPRKPSTTTTLDPRRDGGLLSLRDARGRLAGDWKDPSLSPGRAKGRFGVSLSPRSLAGSRVGVSGHGTRC